MQYRIGTVNVTNGSEIVEGIGTDFPANVHVGDHFKIAGENAIYNINAVNPGPGVQQITISPYMQARPRSAQFTRSGATGLPSWAWPRSTPVMRTGRFG